MTDQPQTEQVHGLVQGGRLLVSQEAYDQLKAGKEPPSMPDCFMRFRGMIVEVSPVLPFTLAVKEPKGGDK